MSDLVTWLKDRLDEDERTALDAGPRHADSFELYVQDDDAYYPLVVGPKFVLADIAAKRALIAVHAAKHVDPCVSNRWPCDTLRILASAYAHQDSYREDWKP